MSAKKFEQLINLIINEDKEKAEQLFHEIVVEKSREIYESIIDEDQSMGLLDEIESEDQGMDGMMEADEEFETDEEIDGDYDVDGEEEDFSDEEEDEFDMDDMEDEEDMDDEDMDGEGDEEELEDRVVDLEDKLDQLMADFEAQMGSEDDGEEVEVDAEMSDEEVMESMELKKVSVTHGDNGVQTKSPGLANPKRVQTGGAPVKFADGGESEPRSTPKVSNAYTKGEGKLSASAKNVDGAYAFKEKGEAAPKPKTETIKAKSPVAESKTAKRRI